MPTLPSADPRERIRQLRLLKTTYDRLSSAPPNLPPRESALPIVLATKTIQETISGTKAAISATEEELAKSEALLRQEEANLNDANALTASLESRIERLRTQQMEKSQKSSAQAAKESMKAKQKQKQDYDREVKKLRAAFDQFIDEHLAGMLAAEELGGPVVGEMMDVDDDVLAAGFSQHGRAKSTKSAKPVSDPKRQRRIDEIWGRVAEDSDEPLSERDAAGEELRELIGELIDALIGDDGSGVYVRLERDSAAARFLVRAKVAQFHPKDARRLKMLDFGRELDD